MTTQVSRASDIDHIQQLCQEHFGVHLTIKKIVTHEIPTGSASLTTIFETDRQRVYALCTAPASLTLGDVKRIVKNMGMEAEAFVPPHNDGDYFIRLGQEAFTSTYPNRPMPTEQLVTYQDFVRYSPALVQIRKVSGEIREYFSVLHRWQKTHKYSYLRIPIK